jgi:dTDP-4-dehydrorhamnose reductase
VLVDLSQTNTLSAFLDEVMPTVIIHTAAERRPDVSERDPSGTQRLNVEATATLARWAAAHRVFLVYLSTDYVFDGTTPPYRPGDEPHPLNAYGQSKLDGERAVRDAGGHAAILRVPILYGSVETLDESAVTVLAKALIDARNNAAQPLLMEHWATRYPTLTDDVAVVLRQMVEYRLTHPDFGGIFHWSGNEPMTKYDMACAFAALMSFDVTRLVADPQPPRGAPRPRNAHLDTSDLERLGIGQRTAFAEALPAILAPHVGAP